LGDYSLRYDSLAVFDTPDGRNVARAVVTVEKNGQYIGELHPRRDFFFESQQPMTIPGVRSTWEDDLYVILVDWLPVSSQGATFKIYHNPLINWLWLGGLVFILGTLVAAWPDKDPEVVPARARRPAVVSAEA
jgi:cytochrome c-type biogenesis protein CcmF